MIPWTLRHWASQMLLIKTNPGQRHEAKVKKQQERKRLPS